MSDHGKVGESADAWSFEEIDLVGILSDQRIALGIVLEEENRAPPVMFNSKANLQDWAKAHNLICDKLKDHNENYALHVHGEYHSSESYFRYEQVWVLASYYDYARAQKDALELFYGSVYEYIESEDGGQIAKIKYDRSIAEIIKSRSIDADHVINKNSLSKNQPDAWVLLYPVPRNANRGFGSKIEKFYPSVSGDVVSVELPPQVAFKLFCGSMPRNMQQFMRAMSKVRGQIDCGFEVARKYVDEMEISLAPYFIKRRRILRRR